MQVLSAVCCFSLILPLGLSSQVLPFTLRFQNTHSHANTCPRAQTHKREKQRQRDTDRQGRRGGMEGEKDLGSIIWVSESYLPVFILWLPGALVLQYVLQQTGDGEAHSLDIFIWNLPFLKIPRWIVSTRTEMWSVLGSVCSPGPLELTIEY